MDKSIYLDNAATTPVSNDALGALLAAPDGNPNSVHSKGREAAKALKWARETIASCINAEPDEIYFTSGGTESCNWAMRNLYENAGPDYCASAVEHHAVLDALKCYGCSPIMFPVNKYGMIIIPMLGAFPNVLSVMHAQNEVGSINPITEINGCIRDVFDTKFIYSDCTASCGHIPVDFKAMGVDYISFAAHKFGSIAGAGVLVAKKDVPLSPIFYGGGQENGKRAGTPSVALICAMAAALMEATVNMQERAERVCTLRDALIEGILSDIPRTHLNGAWTKGCCEDRLPGNVSISFEGISAQALLLLLDLEGICASAGSACSSGSVEPSHVLTAMGVPRDLALGTVRFSLDVSNTKDEIDTVLKTLPKLIKQLRGE